MENLYVKKISEVLPKNDAEVSEGFIVQNREQLVQIVEEPCLAACMYLYDRNIQTTTSSANRQNVNRNGFIGIDYNSLSEENKEIVNELIKRSAAEISEDGGHTGSKWVMIEVVINEDSTVRKC